MSHKSLHEEHLTCPQHTSPTWVTCMLWLDQGSIEFTPVCEPANSSKCSLDLNWDVVHVLAIKMFSTSLLMSSSFARTEQYFVQKVCNWHHRGVHLHSTVSVSDQKLVTTFVKILFKLFNICTWLEVILYVENCVFKIAEEWWLLSRLVYRIPLLFISITNFLRLCSAVGSSEVLLRCGSWNTCTCLLCLNSIGLWYKLFEWVLLF